MTNLHMANSTTKINERFPDDAYGDDVGNVNLKLSTICVLCGG